MAEHKNDTTASLTTLDLERIIELDFMRTTEAAALNAFRWLGKGDPQAAHAAAVDAIRGMMDITPIRGTVLLGEGLHPQPGGIETGEKMGIQEEGRLAVELAFVPIDGVNLVANGYYGAVSVLAAAPKIDGKSGLMQFPCRYAEKIAFGPGVKIGPEQVHLNASVRDNLEIISGKLGKRVQDLSVMVLDRPRHEKLIADIRRAGASARLISDGDIAACLSPSQPDTGIDVYMGIGGAAEAVMAAAAIRCMGGGMLVRPAPMDDEEKKKVTDAFGAKYMNRQFTCEDLVPGDSIIFCATGISDGSFLRGVHVEGTQASTSSVVMRTRYRTVRKIKAVHDLAVKTIRLRASGEAKL